MDTRKRYFVWGDTIAVFIASVILISVIYPFLMKNDNRTRGVVIDEAMRPIPEAVLEVRDSAGRALGRVTTDANGEFLWNRAWKLQGTTFGKYGVTRLARSSGGRDHIYLAPLVLHRVRVRNAVAGLPEADLILRAVLDSQPYSSVPDFHTLVCQTSDGGTVEIGTFPSTVRLNFSGIGTSVKVWNVVSSVVRHKEPYSNEKEILYDVTVVPTGSISGRVVSENGTPVAYAEIGLRLTRSTLSDAAALSLRTQVTTNGSFQFTGLVPGRYKLGCLLTDGRETNRDIAILSGQAAGIKLNTSTFAPSPMLPPDIR